MSLPPILEEMRQQRADVERIERMICALKKAENALRMAHDERRCLGGGSRTHIGALLGVAQDEQDNVMREISHFALDYPVRMP